MTLPRRAFSLAVLAALAGCRLSEPVGNPDALVGRWGGVGAEVEGRGSATTLRMACDVLTFAAPMVVGSDGRFVVPATGRSRSVSFPSPPAVLRGSVSGTTLTVDALFVRPDTSWTVRFVLQEDAAPDLSGACAT